MKIKIQDLSDAQANKFCARAQGWRLSPNLMWLAENENVPLFSKRYYTPTTNWQQAFDLQIKYKLQTDWLDEEGVWVVNARVDTKAESLSRAIVNRVIASVHGDSIETEGEG